MKFFIGFPVIIVLFLLSCRDRQEPISEGEVSISISQQIEVKATPLRISEVSVDTFALEIRKADHSLFHSWDNFSQVPEQVKLPAGQYYAVAFTRNADVVAFENPGFYGISEIFTIVAGQTNDVEVVAEISNAKVTVSFSDQVKQDFNDYQATISNADGSLVFISNETRPGYFTLSDLSIQADFTYVDLNGDSHSKSISGSVTNLAAATHYQIKVDASPINGRGGFSIQIDEQTATSEYILADRPLDADGDGFDVFSGDCDDNDATVRPGSQEICDGIDNDCDGAVDELCPSNPASWEGVLLISEIMYNPSDLSDAVGEWFEIRNISNDTISLSGIYFKDLSDSLAIATADRLPPGSYLALGNTDTLRNVTSNLLELPGLSLGNSGDLVSLWKDGVLIDEVNYGSGFPNEAGTSIQLDPAVTDHLDNNDGANWCLSQDIFSNADRGTPGSLNSACN